MEDVLRPEFGENGFHPGLVGHVRHEGLRLELRPAVLDFEPEVVERRLGRIDQDELVGIEHRHLAHDLAADGARGAGDEHSLPFQMRRDLLHVDLDGIAAEQVLDLDLLHHPFLRAGVPVIGHLRRQENLDSFLEDPVRQVRFLQGLGLGRRNDQSGDAVLPEVFGKCPVIGIHVHAHHHLAHHSRVITHEAHNPETVVRLRTERFGDVDSRRGPVDVSVLHGLLVLLEVVVQHLDDHPGGGQDHESDHIGDDQDRDVGKPGSEDGLPEQRQDDTADESQGGGHEDMHHVHEGRKPEDVRIGPEKPEEKEIDHGDQEDGQPGGSPHLDHLGYRETDEIGEYH